MQSFGFNRMIFTEPFAEMSIKTEIKGGFATMKQNTKLSKLKVIVGNFNHTIPAGSFVYLQPDAFKNPWANKVYEYQGQKVIMVPEDFVYLVETE